MAFQSEKQRKAVMAILTGAGIAAISYKGGTAVRGLRRAQRLSKLRLERLRRDVGTIKKHSDLASSRAEKFEKELAITRNFNSRQRSLARKNMRDQVETGRQSLAKMSDEDILRFVRTGRF